MSQDFYFLLMPGFSAIGFISAIEPLRVANRFRGELYRWHVLSADGGRYWPATACRSTPMRRWNR